MPRSFSSRLFAASAALLALGAATKAQTIPAFPGAEGYGAYARGGRGGDVYIVTNLNASGAGSFADAIGTVPAAGRTIVFEVSGYIRFPNGSDGTRLTSSKVTIAGQTAPGDGVGFFNNMLRISGDDVVLRHLRFRRGNTESSGDCINLDSGCLNAILDHVSIQFSTDENISSFSSPPENITMQWSLNAWGLESHSCGGLWDQNHASCHHTLWAHNHTRNPKARPNGLLEWINNVTFDWDIGFIMGDTQSNQNYKSNVINNYFIGPPGNTRSKALVKGTVGTNGRPNFTVHLSGNLIDVNGNAALDGVDNGYSIVEGTAYAPGTSGLTPGAAGYYQSASAIVGSPLLAVPVTTDSALVAYKKTVSNAGALRLDAGYAGALRDEVDTVLINKLTSLSRFHVSSETALVSQGVTGSGMGTLKSAAAPVDTDRDGMPDYYETALTWSVATQDHNTALANSGGTITGTTFFPANTPAGYTRLEEYLHFKAIPHGTVPRYLSGDPATSLVVDLRKYTSGFSSSPTFAVSNVSTNGSVVLSGPGNAIATFTPNAGASGRARFDFTVTDSQGGTWAQTFGIVIMNAGLPRDLVWKGTGNTWDQATATNWLRPSNNTTVVFSDGDRVALDDSGIAQPNVSVPGAVVPSTIDVNAAGDYTFSGAGSINSTGTLTKRGAGRLTFTGASQIFSKIALDEGTIALGGTSGLSGGTMTMLDGTALENVQASGNQPAFSNPIEVPAGHNATIRTGNRVIYNGAVTGAGTLNYQVQTTVSRADLKGAMGGFAGRINFLNTGGVRLFYVGGSFDGFGGAHVDVGGNVSLQPQTNSGGNTLSIGALSASGTGNLAGGTAGTVTYVVGGRNSDTTFAGSITGNAALTKAGTGTLTLSGSSNYTGATNVNSGWLLVDGVLGATPVTVASGAFLGGDGTIGGAANGAVTASSGATLSPGTQPFTGATLTVGNGLALGGNTLYFDMSSSPAGANDKIVLQGGTMALTGTQFFQFLLLEGTLAAGTYDLITGGTATTASSVSLTHNLPAGTRQTFSLSRSSAGAGAAFVRLTVTGNPATLTWTGAGSATWDTTTATNWSGASPSTFSANDAVVFDDSSAVNAITISAAVAPRSVLVNNTTRSYSFGGAAITGSASLTKSGAGALTFNAANSYTGPTTINAGATITLANDTANASALGSGPITLNGGTITMFNSQSGFSSSIWNLVVPAGQTGTLNADSRHTIRGTLTGGGAFTFRTPWIRTELDCDWSAFTGQINVTTDADGGDLRMITNYVFPGFPLAGVHLSDRVSAYFNGILAEGAGTTIEFGELSGAALSSLLGGPASSGARALTYVIGGRGTDATFAGTIAEQDPTVTTTAFVKRGAGVWTLSGTCAWNGGTTVEGGTLRISGSLTSNGGNFLVLGTSTLDLANGTLTTSDVQISSGAKLTGRGTINGGLTNAGTITCGAGGTLTVTGDVVNDGTMRFTGGTGLVASGHFVNNGVLDLLTGAQSLPADLENNGVIIDNSSLGEVQAAKAGNTVTLSVQTFAGHSYQLQRSDSLASPSWTNIGTPQTGDGTVRNFVDTTATGTQRFYRVAVSP